MGSLRTRFAKQGERSHVCKALEATAGDVWLVDSGATCHIVSTQHLSGFRVVKKHERTANLFNASGGSIVVSGVVDLEVHFGLQRDFSLDGFRERLEDLPCERWVEVVQGEQEEHQSYGCSAGLVGSEREQEESQTPAERRGSYGD